MKKLSWASLFVLIPLMVSMPALADPTYDNLVGRARTESGGWEVAALSEPVTGPSTYDTLNAVWSADDTRDFEFEYHASTGICSFWVEGVGTVESHDIGLEGYGFKKVYLQAIARPQPPDSLTIDSIVFNDEPVAGVFTAPDNWTGWSMELYSGEALGDITVSGTFHAIGLDDGSDESTKMQVSVDSYARISEQPHETHWNDPKGPKFGDDCTGCHVSAAGGGDLKEGVTLDNTTVCNPCHSPNGAYDGVGDLDHENADSVAFGAKYNFRYGGVYEADGRRLKAGKEKWCAGCHDGEAAYSQPCDPEGGAEAVAVVVDNWEATYAGTWPLVEGNACAYEDDFQWSQAGSGSDTATWRPDLPEAGDYKVYARWVANPNRATDAPYTIHYDGGSQTIDVDQTTAGCIWNLLGIYPFAMGTSGSIVLTDQANGYLIADAIKLELVISSDLVMNNSEAAYAGTWPSVMGNPCAYQEDFQWNEKGSGSDTATWTPYVYDAGDYSVYARWVAHPNRATDAPYTITYTGGSQTIDVDQTTDGSQWNLLGTFPFAAGTAGSIALSDDANGYLIADGIRLVSVDVCPEGAYAPNVVGDDIEEGFFVSGHKMSCLACHDAGRDHIDHFQRTYASVSANYQAGYRLRSVGARQPMNTPRPKSKGDPHTYLDDFALCFDCHNANALLGTSDKWDASKTNFEYNSGANGHYTHLVMGKATGFDSDFDGVGDSDFTCTACHNVHGSSTPAMTRDGALMAATRDDLPPDFGALNFSYLPPGATVVDSTAGEMVLGGAAVLDNGICGATCHGLGATCSRTACCAPKVLRYPKIDRVFNDGVDTTLLTAYVLDHHAATVPTVTVDATAIGGASDTDMYDDGLTGGDETAGDHIYTCETTVPDTVVPGPTSLDVTATDGDGTATNQVELLVVAPEEVIMDNADAQFAGTWPLVTGSGCAHQGDFQWNGAGTGTDTATWIPDLAITGLYQVYACWVAHPNRATDASYTIHYDGGSETVYVDCTLFGCQWNLLGTYQFAAGTSGSVVLSDDANGYITADGVKWTLIDPSSIVLDNSAATYVGTWPLVTGNPCAYQENFQWNEADSGSDTATWRPYVPVADDYNVYARWVAHSNRAPDAPYTIHYNGGSETVYMDQRVDGCDWRLLGTYPFAVGSAGSVVLCDAATGYLIADAIKLEVVP